MKQRAIPNSLESQLHVEKIQLLFKQSFPAVFVSFSVSVLLTVVLWPVQDHGLLLAWLAILTLSSLVRLGLFVAYRRRAPSQEALLAWEKPYIATLMLSSAIWGVGCVLIMPHGAQLEQAVIFYCLIGMSGGAIAVYSAHRMIALMAVAFVLLPVTLWMMWQATLPTTAMAIGALFLFASLVKGTEVLSSALRRSGILNYQLQEANDHIERLARKEINTARLERDAANELNRQIISSAGEGIIVFDKEGRYRLWNPFMESLTGMVESDCLGKLPHEVFPFLGETGITDSIRRALAGETVKNPPFQWSVPNTGRSGWAVSMQSPLRDNNGEVVGVLDVVSDITVAKRAEDELQLAATVYRSIGEAIMVADANNYIIAVNPAFTSLTGYGEQEAIGQQANLLKSGKHPASFYRDMWLGLETTGHWQGEIWNRHKNGEICQEWLVITTVYGDDGAVEERIGMLSSVTDQKRTAQSIWQQASFDPLTGLPNRRLLHNRLEQEVKKAHRCGESLALLFIDLDGFKQVNDTLGHDKGDLLLQEVAQRLMTWLRESDTVARLGGDDFTIITEIESKDYIERVVKCLLPSLAEPFSLGEDTAKISASVGIALYPDDALSVDDLLKSADKAMYVAKQQGRNTHCYFTPDMKTIEQGRE